MSSQELRPASGYKWEPFQPGHTLSLRHGAYSPRVIDPLVESIIAAVLADPATSYLQAPRYRPALWAWGRAEAKAQVLSEYLAKAGEATGDGVGDLDADRVMRAELLLHRAEARALSGRRALGLDPLAAAKLHRDKAATGVDVARLMAEMDRAEKEQAAKRAAGEVIEGGDAS